MFVLEWADFDIEPTDGLVKGPTLDDVESIVRHMTDCTDGFVILGVSDMTYVQTTFRDMSDPDAGLKIEWQDGDTDRHYELDEEYISPDRAAAVFKAFFQNPAAMQSVGSWTPIEF